MRELHMIRPASLRDGVKLRLVVEHFRERHLGLDDLLLTVCLHSGNSAASAVEVAHNVT